MQSNIITISHDRPLRVEDVAAYARHATVQVELDSCSEFVQRIEQNRRFLEASIEAGKDIYGVNTGFGESSKNAFGHDLAVKLQRNLIQYHGCGVGEFLNEEECAATLIVRLNCLARGYSGVSPELLQRLERFASARAFPAIRAQGSVGASGDLTPLSYIAACLLGDRQVYFRGGLRPTAAVMGELGIKPYAFKEREALAIMNGTSTMTGLASLAWVDAKAIADQACVLTGLLVELIDGLSAPFTAALNAVKPHPGQLTAAENILRHIAEPNARHYRVRGAAQTAADPITGLQDCYSVRCAPQVIGVLYDVLTWSKGLIEIEINSVNDNPVISDRTGEILNGGLFFGGHIAAACDALKAAVSNVVNLADRQLALMMSGKLRAFLPENLVAEAALGSEAAIHHSFKAMQITMSALAAECAKNSMPMGVFSRPTEASNQDVVSMGTIAARDLRTINRMAQDAIAIHAMSIRQGFYVQRQRPDRPLNACAQEQLERLSAVFSPVIGDRYLDTEIEQTRIALFAEAHAKL